MLSRSYEEKKRFLSSLRRWSSEYLSACSKSTSMHKALTVSPKANLISRASHCSLKPDFLRPNKTLDNGGMWSPMFAGNLWTKRRAGQFGAVTVAAVHRPQKQVSSLWHIAGSPSTSTRPAVMEIRPNASRGGGWHRTAFDCSVFPFSLLAPSQMIDLVFLNECLHFHRVDCYDVWYAH